MADETLAAAAAALGVPEELVMRSAQARAEAEGTSVEEILAAWAGGQAAPVAESTPSPEPEAPSVEEPTEPEPEAASAESPSAPAAPPVGEAGVPPPPVEVPQTVSAAEAQAFEVVTTIETASLKERTKTQVPLWLSSVFIVVPLVAIFLLTTGSAPDCGQAGALDVDPIRGEVVNCDGSEFTGSGDPGGDTTDYLAIGREVFATTAACLACHGAAGEGIGNFPPLAGGEVLATFPSCTDHIQWVTLGTTGWQSEVGGTYGSQDKPVGGAGVMPGFGAALSEEQLASVALFERVTFGRQGLDEALTDCGLAEPPEEEGA